MNTALTDTSPPSAEEIRSQRELEHDNPHVTRYREMLGLSIEQSAQHARNARAARAARR